MCVGDNDGHFANKLFLDDQFQPYTDYVMTLNTYYDAGVQTVDFNDPNEASKHINKFVSTTTHGEIQDMVQPGNLYES